MKTTVIPNKALALTFFLSVLATLFTSCSHKSNDEDDTFKQSIVDDPQRATRKLEKAIVKDSIRLGDTARTDKDKPK
jgi:hypothetical protein